MKLYQLVVKDVGRRKRRVLYAALGVVVGTMTVVGILTMALAGQSRIYDQLEKYGDNRQVIPSIKSISMELGNLSLGTLAVGDNYIAEDKLPLIRQIADSEIKKALGLETEGPVWLTLKQKSPTR
ncbi:MAG: hypothetical protein V1849_01705 [Chloroflexota bacterium]